jgi:hypothetical protein
LRQVVSEQEISSVRKRKLRILSPRRHKERPVVNVAMEEEMIQLRARLDAMETTQRRALDVGDVDEVESEDVEEEEVVGEQATEE